MYSQNNEEQIIIDYFGKDFKGTLLDLGANDGKTLSNSYAAIKGGWRGVLVEPQKKSFLILSHITHGEFNKNPNIWCFNVAVASEDNEEILFYESGEHLGNGDTGLLSSLKKATIEKWRGVEFKEVNTPVWSFPTLLNCCYNNSPLRVKHFDLISIDCEGMDYDILIQIDLKAIGCKMLIIESNSIEDDKYIDYCAKFGMKLYHKNQENLIFVI